MALFLTAEMFIQLKQKREMCMREMVTINKKRDKGNYLLVTDYIEYDWEELFKWEPEGYSWREEAYLAGEEYFEQDKEYLRCN